jgi:hypothetical protein
VDVDEDDDEHICWKRHFAHANRVTSMIAMLESPSKRHFPEKERERERQLKIAADIESLYYSIIHQALIRAKKRGVRSLISFAIHLVMNSQKYIQRLS